MVRHLNLRLYDHAGGEDCKLRTQESQLSVGFKRCDQWASAGTEPWSAAWL